MSEFTLIISVAAGVILFLFGIEGFSREVQAVAGERFRDAIARLVRRPVHGIFVGGLTTAIVQSSTATSVIAVALVNSGVLTFHQSLGVIIGSNIGTTVTAQLVALKLTAFGSVFLIVGFFISLFRWRFAFLGKAVFYFGLVFFSLNEIAAAIEPLRDDPRLMALIARAANPWVGLLAGALATVVVQSSSVTTGLIVVLVQGGLIGLDAGVPLVLGANIGTTVTSGLAAFKMDIFAKRTAMSHVLFNLTGAILVMPFLPLFIRFLGDDIEQPAQMLANAHLYFNLGATFVFWLFIGPFERIIVRLLPGRVDEMPLATRYISSPPPVDWNDRLEQIENEATNAFSVLNAMIAEASDPHTHDQDDELKQLEKKRLHLDFLARKIRQAIEVFGADTAPPKTHNRLITTLRFIGLVEHAASGLELLSKAVAGVREANPDKPTNLFKTAEHARDLLIQLNDGLVTRMRSKRAEYTGGTEAILDELDELLTTNYLSSVKGITPANSKGITPFTIYIVHLQGLVSDMLEIRRIMAASYKQK